MDANSVCIDAVAWWDRTVQGGARAQGRAQALRTKASDAPHLFDG
jgi:hypothetical protein